MQATEIFGPFFAMILLTFVVWVVMYIGRIRYSIANRVNAQRLGTPEKVVAQTNRKIAACTDSSLPGQSSGSRESVGRSG